MQGEQAETRAQAIEQALRRIGEPISEAQAKEIAALENCDCKDGMFALTATRRHLFGGAGLVAAVGMTAMLPRAANAKSPAGAVEYPVPSDSTKEPGRMMGEDGGYGTRSQFESEVRWVNDQNSFLRAHAKQLWHPHAFRPSLRAPPRRDPKH